MEKSDKNSAHYLFKEYKRTSRLSQLLDKSLVGKHSDIHKMINIIITNINKNLDKVNICDKKRDDLKFDILLFDEKRINYRLMDDSLIMLDSRATHLIYLYVNNNYNTLTYFECISFIIFVLRYSITEHTSLDRVEFE